MSDRLARDAADRQPASASHQVLLGVDLGGTKIECAALDPRSGFLARRRVATPQGDYAGTVAAIAALVASVEQELGLVPGRPLGVAIPGSVSPASGLLRNANSTVLNGRRFGADLEAALARPVRLSNDANCLAVSEAADGAAAGAAVAFAVILGTGVGAGIAIGAREWAGRNGVAGEWGHNPLPWPREAPAWGEVPGPACWCGKHGCIETWLSGPGLLADHRRAGGAAASAEAVIAAMRAGDPGARRAVVRYCDRLARGLAHVIDILDPDVIVLGGGMSNVDELYLEVSARLGEWVFADTVDTPLRRALHGDSSGVRGAAWLWRDSDRAPVGEGTRLA